MPPIDGCARGWIKRRAALPDPFEGCKHAGVKAAVRQPAGSMHHGQRSAQPSRHPDNLPAPGEPVERHELAVRPKPGQGDIHGVELRPHRVPGGCRADVRLPGDVGVHSNLQAQRRSERARGEPDESIRLLVLGRRGRCAVRQGTPEAPVVVLVLGGRLPDEVTVTLGRLIRVGSAAADPCTSATSAASASSRAS